MYELEDIEWGEFSTSSDHIVPHPGATTKSYSVEQGGCDEKPHCEAASAVGRTTYSKTTESKNVLQVKDPSTSLSAIEDGKAPMLEKGSWSNANDSLFPASCDTDCIDLADGVAYEDSKISTNCFDRSNADSVGNEFCTDDPILRNGAAVVDSNLCHFQLDDISAAESDHELFGNRHNQKDSNDLLDYGWPDIGNFEDIDRMFRNCDSTFGQGNASTTNELSWFSTSSHAIKDTPKLDSKSLYSETGALKSALDHETSSKFIPPNDHLSIPDCDKKKDTGTSKNSFWKSDANGYCTYMNWNDGDTGNEEETASINQMLEHTGSDGVKISPPTQISNESSVTGCQGTDLENMERKRLKSQSQLERNRKAHFSDYFNGTTHGPGAVQQFSDLEFPSSASSSHVFSEQKRLWRANSFNYLHEYVQYGQQEYSHPSHPFPGKIISSSFKPKTRRDPHSCRASGHALNNVLPLEISPDHLSRLPTPDDKIKGPHHPQQIRGPTADEHRNDQFRCDSSFIDEAPVQKQLHQRVQDEVGGDSEVEQTATEFAIAEIDSTLQESSCMSSILSNGISLEAASFRQLQDVMEQLDNRTKLCIRDSLYRLARSAEQRHSACKTSSSSRDEIIRNGAPSGEENKCVGFMDPETETNPIDRSIARLLFYKPLKLSTRPSNDALYHESNIRIRGSTSNQPVIHDQLVGQKDSDADTIFR